MDEDNQFLIGGESGLRGYPSRIQDGSRRFLFTVEQRFYSDWHIFQLIHVGGAIFFDVGRAWTPGVNPQRYDGVLKDAGFGLRFTSSRSTSGSVLHADVAYAIDGGDDIDKVQFNVSTEARF